MTNSHEISESVYRRFEQIADALRTNASPIARYTLLSLLRRAGLHPALEPFRLDPLLSLNGSFVSLAAQVAGISAMLDAHTEPSETIGSVGGTLYLPAGKSVSACRVRSAYLPAHPVARWQHPVAVHPVSPDLEASAQRAFEAALQLILFVCPGEQPPAPALVFWGADGVEDAVAQTTAGDSLQLPLTLSFVSALTRLPVASRVGATGAVQTSGRLSPVGFVDEKGEAFLARHGEGSVFLTPDDGADIREIAMKLGDDWRKRFATPVKGEIFAIPSDCIPTFVCAEIENAPVFWANHAAVFRAALPNYEAMFVDSVARYGGKTYRAHTGTGEGLGAVFAGAKQATDAAVHLLRCARAGIWEDAFGDSLPIRIGIHRGDGEPSGNGWRGAGPALAERIASAASAYQILTSDAVHRATNPADWVNHGKHRLRDLSDAVTLWQVTSPDIKAINVPPESFDTRHHNLPAVLSPLVGRDDAIENLLEYLTNERFITLTGAGGVGKTRLAIAVAARALFETKTAARFTDGAFYVSLDDESRDERAISDAVCEAIGVTKIASLAAKRLLLILDNAESAADSVARFSKSLLNEARDVVFLITSRIPIRLHGEKRVGVSSLDIPKGDAEEQEWEQASAVRLFLDRARAIEEQFSIATQTERDALTNLLRRLDGLPLAIELAASRTRYLSVSEIESRLADSLRLLSTRETDVPERQRTLIATLEWSYTLLSAAEQRLLQRVSVFVGGFGVDAAEAMMGEDPDTLDLLASLEEQSLLVCQRAEKGEPPRFSLLQTVSDFVRSKRHEGAGEDNSIRETHARYFMQFAERNGGEDITLSARETEAFDALERDMGNLRAAWSYLREIGDTERCARLAVNLSDFLRRRGHARERLDWIETALATTDDAGLRRRLLYVHAMTLRDIGRVTESDTLARSLQSLVEQTGDTVRLADVLALRGSIGTHAKQFGESEQFFDDAERLYRLADHKPGIGTVCRNRAVNAMRMGEMERAKALLEKALQMCDEIGDEQAEAYVHNNLGHLLSEEGNHAKAIVHFLHQLNFCRRNADTIACAVSLFNIGEALLHLKRGDGLPLMIAASEIFSRVGHPYAEATRSESETWREKTNTTQGSFAALRRASSRRTLAELRESYISD
ncbi:MAG: hypothetical protein H8F28_15620 [Fibrella sp.]|nr:hypothetical protein [Armatimonadota bacterium]